MSGQLARPPSPEAGRVLVVDDDEHIGRMLVRVLTSAGHEASAVTGADEALSAARETRPDAVFLDVHLAGLDGLVLGDQLRQAAPGIQIVLMTGDSSVQTAATAVSRGAFRYLLKPLETKVIQDTAREAVAAARAQRAPSAPTVTVRPERFREALDQLWIAYQPIIRHSTREVVAYEALMRSRDAELGSPLKLLTAAEQLGRVGELGTAVRRRALAPWLSGDPGALLFLNLHAIELQDSMLIEREMASVASRVVLELTERAALDAVGDAPAHVERLRAAGLRLAIDDLGAGYSGLSSLVDLEPEVVKIDMSLVRGIDQSPRKRKLVRSIVVACEDILLVAEGVETKAELDTLVDAGCDVFQGYFFAKPGPPFPTPQWP